MIGVAIVGYGYWGPNILRNFLTSPMFRVIGVADPRQERLEDAGRWAKDLVLTQDAGELIRHRSVDAVAVVTPVSSHFALARLALEHGRHVLVEKPLCLTTPEADELIALAARADRTLMVDHTFLFNGAVQEIKRQIDAGSLGQISYYDCMRVNLGLFQSDTNVLWDLAPHDFSIMDYLLNEEPNHVDVQGYCHVNAGLADITYITAFFASGRVAHFNLSWMSPVKMRRTSIGGNRKMAIWDDLDRDAPVKIYDAGIHVQPEDARMVVIPSYRIGDMHCPRVSDREPLAAVVEHFGQVIRGDAMSLLDGLRGRRIVGLLERCQAALDKNLSRIGQSGGRVP